MKILVINCGSSSIKYKFFDVDHRVVHGGDAFHEPTLIDDRVIADIKACIPLAPVHNPAP